MRVSKQSTARNVSVLMIDSSDHISGKASLTLTITASKDGGAFASTTPTVTDLGSGWYKLALTTTDTNTLGDLALHITGTGADPQDVLMQVVAYDTTDATALGLSRLDAAITSRMATYTQPSGFLAATFPGTVASTTNITSATGITVSTNSDKTGYTLSSAGVQAIWDALTSALTTVGSIGKLIVTNLDALISSRMATYTQPTGFLAATFPTGTIANTTNITAGTIANVGTLTTYTGNTPQTGDSFARLGAPVGASHSADVAAVKALLPTALVGGKMDASVGAMAAGVLTSSAIQPDAINATALAASAASEIADAVLAATVEGSSSLKQMVQDIGAATAGKNTGAGTGTVTFRNVSDTADGLVATIDGSNNRTAITRTRT